MQDQTPLISCLKLIEIPLSLEICFRYNNYKKLYVYYAALFYVNSHKHFINLPPIPLILSKFSSYFY